MVLTKEQLNIIICEKSMIVNAIAGTGKTTTLIEYAKERQGKEILYLVFNKDLRKSVRNKFPLNTTVHTVNSFIYKNLKEEFSLRDIVDNYSIYFFIDNFTDKNKHYDLRFEDAFGLMTRMNIFLDKSGDLFKDKEIEEIFNKIISNNKLQLSHNILKKYFLLTADFSKFKYDIILIDEAQDIDLIMLNIIEKINAIKVFVGDKKQAIYGFRNAINIFNLENPDYEKFSLTKSFRFNSDYSDFVAKVTKRAYNEDDFYMDGYGTMPCNIIHSKEDNLIGPHVVITRTNAFLFTRAFEAVEAGKKVSIPFNFEDVKYLMIDILNLQMENFKNIRNHELKVFKSFDQFKASVKRGLNAEHGYIIKIIEEHGLNIVTILKKLEVNLVSPKYADIVFLTGHKSKGLEFDSVEVADDFKNYNQCSMEEKNLFYVAITRSRGNLKINSTLLLS